MPSPFPEIVVAGHVCLDVIPSFPGEVHDHLFEPGTLVEVGPPVMSPGGVVSNVGVALHRLGVRTTLIGKVGDDLFGRAVLDILHERGRGLAANMIVDGDASTSYTIVLSPPGRDRTFLHAPGANDTFHPTEIEIEPLGDARVFHFGYPPLMEQTYADAGKALADRFARIRRQRTAVSLDTAQIDPNSKAGSVDWTAFLRETLPQVDVFGPSIGEIRFMLDRSAQEPYDASILAGVANRLVEMGAAIVVLKLGSNGLFLRTTDDPSRLENVPGLDLADPWRGRTLLHPCFDVEAVGTTGAGDCTLAGFLAALLKGRRPEQCLRDASAVGASSVETADSTSGVPAWSGVQRRIEKGWPQRAVGLDLDGWTWIDGEGLWSGPHRRSVSS